MIQMYVRAILSGRMTINDVPAMYRKEVEEVISQ